MGPTPRGCAYRVFIAEMQEIFLCMQIEKGPDETSGPVVAYTAMINQNWNWKTNKARN